MRIAIVDDHSLVREMLEMVCVRLMGHAVVGLAESGESAIALVARTEPDVVLLDIRLPDMTGFAVAEAIRRTGSRAQLLLLSGYCDDRTVYLAEQAHVQGFLDKLSSPAQTIRAALAALARGQTYFSPAFCRKQADRHRNPWAFEKILSDHEQQILLLIGRLLRDEEISERLGISRSTVEKHRFNIRRKLGLRSHAELMRYIRDHGFMADQIGGGESGMPGSSRP